MLTSIDLMIIAVDFENDDKHTIRDDTAQVQEGAGHRERPLVRGHGRRAYPHRLEYVKT